MRNASMQAIRIMMANTSIDQGERRLRMGLFHWKMERKRIDLDFITGSCGRSVGGGGGTHTTNAKLNPYSSVAAAAAWGPAGSAAWATPVPNNSECVVAWPGSVR